MMLIRNLIRVKALRAGVNGHFPKTLNTSTEAATATVCSESKAKTYNDKLQQLELSTDESVSYYLPSLDPINVFFVFDCAVNFNFNLKMKRPKTFQL